ncbi:MAG: nucleotide pyrophosphohydrolase [Candidatus Nanohaloarchaea archaeon]
MSFKRLKEEYAKFKDQRDWEKFHQPKNIAMSISIEASELMELFQWKDNVSIERIKQDEDLMAGIREELADVVLYSLSMAQRLDIDIEKAVLEKLEENRQRFDKETAEEIKEDLEEWTG